MLMNVFGRVDERYRTILLSYLLALGLLVGISIVRPGFGSPDHLRSLAIEASIIGIVGLGQTLVILTGGIDLSIPWTLNSVAVLLTLFAAGKNENLVWAIPVVLGLALGIGLLNGVGISLLGISPVIMTLGMNAMLQGILLGYTSGGRPGSTAPPAVAFLALGDIGGIPTDLIFWALVILAGSVLLGLTTTGRRIYAIGNNAVAARFSGVSVRRVQIAVYCLSALTAGIAGIVLTGKIGRSFLGMGDLYTFASVAAVAIGGASILGGSGNYLGTVAGAFTLTLIAGLLPIFNLPASFQQILYGLIVLVMVLLARNRALER